MHATYSPEDNKLRLYAETRLDAETYARVKEAGFKWAPKQDLFVAPMWTPVRENLLLELCGEVGDEDTTLAERQEQRAERFEDYKDNRKADAEQAHAAVSSICDGIPLGQPILVGHHSEKRARKDAERIENGMRKAVRMWETSEYWKQRAAGAIRHAKYKERPDVRARRIKGIEADKRKQERNRAEQESGLKFWSGGFTLKHNETGATRPLEITEENRERISELVGRIGALSFNAAQKEGGARWEGWSAWDVLRPDEERYKACPSMTVEQVQNVALEHYPKMIAGYQRWIDHYENRLTYERAMLAADGGTETDKNAPQKGGACKCWASHRGGWSYIVKVNRVSVSVLDNWGNGGANFPRVIQFDKLVKVMSAEAVQTARDTGQLIECGDKTGFFLRNDVDGHQAQETGDERNARLHAEHMTAKAEKDDAKPFEAMKETLKAGIEVVSAPQLFPTPPGLVLRMVELADIWCVQRILEPSAGTGAILERIVGKTSQSVVAVEINSSLAEQLRNRWPGIDTRCADFLACNGDLGKFDRILMNPPFASGQDIKHILHAITFLKPGGRLVAICANGPRQQEQLQPLCETWIDLEPGTFKESGTNVNAALLVITP